MKYVLVAGATGYLGRFVTAELKKQGYRVRALVRQRDLLWKRGMRLAPAVGAEIDEIVVADVVHPQSLVHVCHQIDYVISTIGWSAQPSHQQSRAQRQKPEDIDYHGNRNLLITAINAGSVEKFISVSRFAPQGKHELIQLKEKFVTELQESVMTSFVVRPNLMYPELLPLLYMAHYGHIWLPGLGELEFNPIHGEDLAKICVQGLIAKEKEMSVGGPKVMSWTQAAELAFEVHGKKAQIHNSPKALQPAVGVGLNLIQRKALPYYKALKEPLIKTGVTPKKGQIPLKDYFEAYLKSPFFRA